MRLFYRILLCILLCLGLGFYSGYYSGTADSEWYQSLSKPFFQPPAWLFGPAWTILYTLMGVAVALIWHNDQNVGSRKTAAITLFLFQLFLNLIWSPIFFKMQAPKAALVVIINLIVLVILTMRAFAGIDKRAMFLMLPYLGWICFATVLNASIVYLNN